MIHSKSDSSKNPPFLGDPQCPKSGHWGSPKNGGFFDESDSGEPELKGLGHVLSEYLAMNRREKEIGKERGRGVKPFAAREIH